MTDTRLILHHYDLSPFSEKVRVLFGIKELAWQGCEQPDINPKPDLVALTGGYRRIPVLQIGADLYCDSGRIVEEIETRFPTLDARLPGPVVAEAVLPWCEGEFFAAAVMALFPDDWDCSAAFLADRSGLLGSPFAADDKRASLPKAERELQRHLATVTRLLADGRAFLLGHAPDVTDAMLFALIRFMRSGLGRTARLVDRHPLIAAWEARVRAIGHGHRGPDVDRTDAIAITHSAAPAPPLPSEAGMEAAPGDQVRFRYADANSPVLEGRLLHIDARTLSIGREIDGGGRVHLHLPRTAGQLES